MDSSIRYRIATRIHDALLRELGEGIDVVMMLGRDAYAREVLHVCDGLGDHELMRMAKLFRAATIQELRAEREEEALRTGFSRTLPGYIGVR